MENMYVTATDFSPPIYEPINNDKFWKITTTCCKLPCFTWLHSNVLHKHFRNQSKHNKSTVSGKNHLKKWLLWFLFQLVNNPVWANMFLGNEIVLYIYKLSFCLGIIFLVFEKCYSISPFIHLKYMEILS